MDCDCSDDEYCLECCPCDDNDPCDDCIGDLIQIADVEDELDYAYNEGYLDGNADMDEW